jgi:hypothetical protein
LLSSTSFLGVTRHGPVELGHPVGQQRPGLAVGLGLLGQLVLEQVESGPFEAVLDGE